MTQEVYTEWKRWSAFPLKDADLIKEIEQIKNNKDNFDKEITERFYKELEFGTGGLRGIVGVGSNRMNIYTVSKATMGFIKYLKERDYNKVVIAYDSRIKSELFAKTAAELFTAYKIKVYFYKELTPTPMLSYAIRYLNCHGGIVITASHNPAKYNGYKIYGRDGGQITGSVTNEIQNKINETDIFGNFLRIPFKQAVEKGMVSYIDDTVTEAYLNAVAASGFDCIEKEFPVIYTPLNGTGAKWVQSILNRNGFSNVIMVKEQSQPDGNFPSCPIPNPEMKDAMELGLDYARKYKAELLIATDPDCDRIGAAVKGEKDYRLLTGDEISVLLLDYVCKQKILNHSFPKKPICMKTIVTTDLIYKVGEYYGVEVWDLLTGFKYIGEQMEQLEKKDEIDRFIMGMEESHGYLAGTYVHDKDGVNAALLLCQMTAYYLSKKKTLLDVLKEIYHKFGYHYSTQYNYTLEGQSGEKQIKQIMKEGMQNLCDRLELGGHKIVEMHDYRTQTARFCDGRTKRITLPKSNVCKFILGDESTLIIRPSGTEPKIKLYITAKGITMENAIVKEQNIKEIIEENFAGFLI